MKVVIAEKPSVARDLAAYLGAKSRHDGFLEGNAYQVTWALGHLVSLKEPDEYEVSWKRWNLESLPIIPERFLLKQIGDSGARKQFKIVKNLLDSASEVICATDAGREGELIFRYILEQAMSATKRSKVPMTRLWLSSLTESAIRHAFENRRSLSEYDNLYAAARCRSEADWIVGMNATRNYTVRFGQSGVLWSVGRVQTPVLALLANRDDEIRHFKPVPWFELNTRYREVVFKRKTGRFLERTEAELLLNQLQGKTFTISGVTKKRETEIAPQLYDLTTLQRDLNVRYGMSAADTLKHAQSLYESKAITYPRTDSRYLTRDMRSQVHDAFEKLRPLRGNEIRTLDLSQLSNSRRIFDDSRVTDHHAIIATGSAGPQSNTPGARVFDAIVTRMIAAFYPPCLKDVTTVEGIVENEVFRARGVHVVDAGWTSLYPKKKKSVRVPGKAPDLDEQELPEFTQGESGSHTPFVKEGVTKPPRLHTEGSLLGMMETAGKWVDDDAAKEALKGRGLGTPATRAAIIETLLRRNYVARSGKELHITDLGLYLVALIQDPILKSPEMTGDWEHRLKEVELGRQGAEDFMTQVKGFTHDLIKNSIENSRESQAESNAIGKCPACGAALIEGARGYGCAKWKEGCTYVLWKKYLGHTIEPAQASELIQRHISLRPCTLHLDSGESGSFALYLGSSGKLSHLSLPTKNGQGTNPVGQRKSSPRKTGERKTGERKTSERRTSARKTGSPKAGTKASTNTATNSTAKKAFTCPACQSEVLEREKSFSCSGWKSGCSFTIWKNIAGKAISASLAQKLARQGQTQVLKGFKSKAGKSFDARLKLEHDKVVFDFDA